MRLARKPPMRLIGIVVGSPLRTKTATSWQLFKPVTGDIYVPSAAGTQAKTAARR